MKDIDVRVADTLSHRWSLLLLRGLAAMAFGILTFTHPGISLTALVLLFGAYALLDGVLETLTAIEGRDQDSWWALLLSGLVGIGVGVLTFFAPSITALGLLFYIATWAVARGLLEIVMAIRVRKEVHGEWRLVLAGFASVLFGVVLMVRPGAGALTMLWLIGTYALVFGVLLVLLAFKARSFSRHLAHA